MLTFITAEPRHYLDAVRLTMTLYRVGAAKPHGVDAWTCESPWLLKRLLHGNPRQAIASWIHDERPCDNTVVWCPGLDPQSVPSDVRNIHVDANLAVRIRSESSLSQYIVTTVGLAPLESPKPSVVHMLWVGTQPIGSLQRACIRSFAAHGHRVRLWAYEPDAMRAILTDAMVPGMCEVWDAADVMPASSVFRYGKGIHAGSWVGFSDIFRYRVLFMFGGWWCDTDVTCMGNLDDLVTEPHVFRWMNASEMVAANIMYAPAGSGVMAECHEWAKRHVGPDNEDWLAPTRKLHSVVTANGMLVVPEQRLGGESMRLDWMLSDMAVPPCLKAIHWCAENMRIRMFSGSPGTTHDRILSAYGERLQC